MNRIAKILMATLLILPTDANPDDTVITFNDVAPIFYAKCAQCHRPGEIAPMSLINYKSARPWAKAIKKTMLERSMPPWHADSSVMEYKNDRSLNDAQIQTIVRWVESGAAQGEAEQLPTPPRFTEGWSMGTPDLIFEAKSSFTIPANESDIEYQSITFETDIQEDLYISEWEIRTTVPAAVHHANLILSPANLDGLEISIGLAVLTGGDYIGSYLPGQFNVTYEPGMSLRIPAHSNIGIQVHYIGLDKEVIDHLRFGVKFARGRIDKLVRVIGTDNRAIDIAPHHDNFELTAEATVLHDLLVISSGIHMHLRGKDYTMQAVAPDGTTTLITRVPKYDFNWQSNYMLANPVALPKGGRLSVTAHWDNSDKNPDNPDPDAWVRYGPWAADEMMNTWAHVVLADEHLGLKIVDGHEAGRFDDAQTQPHPRFLQTLPGQSNL